MSSNQKLAMVSLVINGQVAAEIATWNHDQFADRISRLETARGWMLGDYVVAYEHLCPDASLPRLAEDTGVPLKTLEQYRKVSRAYPILDDRSSKRSSKNPWTVHEIFSSQDDRAELVASQVWTVREARDELDRRAVERRVQRQIDGPPRPKREPANQRADRASLLALEQFQRAFAAERRAAELEKAAHLRVAA